VHWNHQAADEEHAQRAGQVLTEYRTSAGARLVELLADAEVRMRMWENDLERWLDEGVFRTLHGGGETSGLDDLITRTEVEASVLGVPAGTLDDGRPRYGYAQGSDEADRQINHYGKILVRFREHVHNDATVVLGDSIGSTRSAGWCCMAPERLRAPELLCRFSPRDVVQADTLSEACDPDYRYAEVQIYGPLSPDSIREVVFCNGVIATRDLRNLLDDWGVLFYEIDDYPA